MCQHIPTSWDVSCAEKDAISGQHPWFRRRWFSPMAIFKWKNLMEQLNPLLEWICWMKVGEGWVCWVQLANMWQHCSVTGVQRKTAYHCVEESWWPEFNLFGSMPWCSFPWHKHLPRLAQKNCCTVYSLNLIHEFTSLFSTNLLYVGLPRKAFPGKQAKVDTGHQCFSMVAQATPQDSPKASPMAIFKWKNLMEQLNPLLEWICWMKVGEGWVCWVQLANMWQHCSVTAVQRKTAYHCVQEWWWPEFNLSGSMPWCSFPWHKHLPRLAQKDCCTVYSLDLIHKFTSLFRWRWFCRLA